MLTSTMRMINKHGTGIEHVTGELEHIPVAMNIHEKHHRFDISLEREYVNTI